MCLKFQLNILKNTKQKNKTNELNEQKLYFKFFV